jgi:anti-anti-sigma factor
MNLVCHSQRIQDVVVVRCSGRIVVGEEVRSLMSEVDKFLLERKKFVLQLADVAYVDSGGLGAMVRLLGTLRAARGDLKLCELSPFLQQVFEATNLKGVFHTYGSEAEAIAAFSKPANASIDVTASSRQKVICIDGSGDLLAYLSALLKRSGYEVYTTKYLSDAATLVTCTHPNLAICGPTTQASATAFAKFREANPKLKIFLLPSDFHAAEAGQAGSELTGQIQALFNTPQ